MIISTAGDFTTPLSNLLRCSTTFTVNALLCSVGVSHMSVCPHCLCPVSENMQPEPDEWSVSSHSEFWIHGSLHGHSNQPNETTSLRGTVFFPSFLSIPFHYPVRLSGNPSVDICKDGKLNILKCMEEVKGGCVVFICWYSVVRILPGISVQVSAFLQLCMKSEYNQCF